VPRLDFGYASKPKKISFWRSASQTFGRSVTFLITNCVLRHLNFIFEWFTVTILEIFISPRHPNFFSASPTLGSAVLVQCSNFQGITVV
jgi:hypothetical protein